ncbi:MAG: transposase [Planctomycetes bacterium]|nr:transposase [Planctomycetota bacterium]
MQLPIVQPAPIVTEHSAAFQGLFKNCCQFQHFQNYLTGLIVLDNKTMANMTRCIMDSPDKTNLSRFFSEADWDVESVNQERVAYLLRKTEKQRLSARKSVLAIDDTLMEHVGSLFEYIDKHYNHGNHTYPLAHNLVTSHYVSGAVRFPVGWRLYRRYEEFTHWEEFVAKHFPDTLIPKRKKERNKFKRQVEPTLLADPEFLVLHEAFRTKISLAVELVKQAIEQDLSFETVLFDSWYLAPELLEVLSKYDKKWISILKINRNISTNNLRILDEAGERIQFEKPKIKLKDLIPLIPPSAFKPVEVGDRTYYCFSKNVHIPSLGKVRLVISFDNPDLKDTCAVLVTNHLSWNAKKIIETYLLRWPIETFYQDTKQQLGLNQYRMRKAKAIQKHWCLVFVAYSFLHLHCLPVSPRHQVHKPLKTIGQIVRQQTRQLIETLLLHTHQLLDQGIDVSQVFTQLFAKQLYTMSP